MSALFADGGEHARRERVEGKRLTGVVLRLPSRGEIDGNRLALGTADGVVSIPATARRGWSVLERDLASVQIGGLTTVFFVAWRRQAEGFATGSSASRSTARTRWQRTARYRRGDRIRSLVSINPMSPTYHNEFRGALFKNNRKTTEKQPDLQGQAIVAGTNYRIAGWLRTSHAGRTYLGLRFDEYLNDQRQGAA